MVIGYCNCANNGSCCESAAQNVSVHSFETHQWQESTKATSFPYLIYRWCVAVQFVTVFVSSIVMGTQSNGEFGSLNWKWVLFLTNWVYTMCTVQSLFALWILQVAWINNKYGNRERKSIPGYYKFYWKLHSIATDGSIVVPIIYWFVVYDPAKSNLDAMNFMVHAGNTVIMLLDMCLVGHPSPFRHAVDGSVVGLCYGLFTYLYHVCGGTGRNGIPYVYKVLDWRNPTKAFIFVLLCTALLITIRCITWTVCKVKQNIAQRLGRSKLQPNFDLPT